MQRCQRRWSAFDPLSAARKPECGAVDPKDIVALRRCVAEQLRDLKTKLICTDVSAVIMV
jgi:hypothetical protein